MTEPTRTQIALGEYAALRAEILIRLAAQTTLVGVCLTAAGVVFGLVLSEKGVPQQTLLIVPPIVGGLGFFYAYNTRTSMLLGKYIRTELWSVFEQDVGDGRYVPSWEQFVGRYRKGHAFPNIWMRARWMFLEPIGTLTVFLLPSVVALMAYSPLEAFDDSGMLLAGWLLGASLVMVEVAVAYYLIRDSEQV